MELLGIAVGNIGMPYNDFCAITPEEFNHIYRAYSEERTAQYQDSWERMRMLAAILLQPHVKGDVTLQKILFFPWEKKKTKKKTSVISKEEAKRRFEAFVANDRNVKSKALLLK